MIEAGDDSRLMCEAQFALVGIGDAGRQKFHGDPPGQDFVLRLEHLAHPTLADSPQQAVTAVEGGRELEGELTRDREGALR